MVVSEIWVDTGLFGGYNKTSKGIIETEIIKNFFTNVPPKKGKNFHKHIIASK